jgi:hypothetical protein
VVSAGASVGIGSYVLIHLPKDYFTHPRARGGLVRRIAKNVAGWSLVFAGVVLSIPGIPGQGLLTIFVGLILADFPRKFAIERALMRNPAIRRGADAIRRRFGHEPFDLANGDAKQGRR